MKIYATRTATQLLVLWLSIFLTIGPVTFAQDNPDVQPPPETPQSQSPSQPTFSQQELDQMLAPIALYPDPLLTQILMASTYPLEVIQAARWSKANPNLQGDQAVQAVADKPWDPSVKSLVAFPQLLLMMDEKLDWMERLGGAFLAQESQVMDTIQQLRQKASAAGNLQSNEQIQVQPQGQTIAIQPTNPQVIYVPYYDPMVVYGPWWWPGYPPVYWGPWPGYYIGPGYGLFAWGLGITLGAGFLFGAFSWPHHHIFLSPGRVWTHDPFHRRGVPYRSEFLRQQFGRTNGLSETRRDFRGHYSFDGRSGFGNRALQGDRIPQGAQRGIETRPGQNGGTPRFSEGTRPGRSPEPGMNRLNTQPPLIRPSSPGGMSRPSIEPRPHAFEGVGHGGDVRNFSARGNSSFRGSAPGPSGGGRGGGGFSGGGHGGGGGGHSHR
ncbi:MAG TPA: DUF3300 domain-containing protein [Nitrospira sp.]